MTLISLCQMKYFMKKGEEVNSVYVLLSLLLAPPYHVQVSSFEY